jgi:hypothetical protein
VRKSVAAAVGAIFAAAQMLQEMSTGLWLAVVALVIMNGITLLLYLSGSHQYALRFQLCTTRPLYVTSRQRERLGCLFSSVQIVIGRSICLDIRCLLRAASHTRGPRAGH